MYKSGCAKAFQLNGTAKAGCEKRLISSRRRGLEPHIFGYGSSQIYGSLMAVDGISVSSPTLDKEDKTAEYREARMGAVLDAYLKAEAYANAAGYAVGNLVSLSDGGGYTPMYARASNVMLAAAAVDMAEGATAEFYLDDIAVSSTVSVQWDLEKLSGTPWVVNEAAVR